MALTVKDRVKESSTTTGTSDFVLGGAAAGFQTFAVIGNTNTTYYAAVDQATGDWEVGVGTYSSTGPTLTRDTVFESSNSGSKVNFAAGSKDVFCTYPAERSVYLDAAGSAVTTLDIGTLGVTTANITTANITSGTVSTAPLLGNDLVNKTYVDTVAAASLHYHEPVFVESPDSTGNLNATYNNGTAGVGATLTNAGTQVALTIDGVLMTTGKRVLVYNQTNAFENGVYTVTTVGDGSTNWVLTRATDADTYAPSNPNSLGQGDAFFVTNGNTGAGETYVCNTVGAITFGTTAITFVQISDASVYTASNGVTLNGVNIELTPTGTAGTYGDAATVPVFTTNAYGQVTSVTPTAIAIAAAAVSGLAPSATTDTTNAANITSGTLPVARLNGSYTGITGVGTLAAGTWNGSTIAAAYGGTGQSSYAVGDILYADGATSLAKLADVVTGNALLSGGVGTAPAWGKIGLQTHISGTLQIANGGTGATDAATARANLGAGTGNGSVTSVAAGSYLTGGTITTSGTLGVDATTTNTAGKVVARDGSGNFSAGTVTANLTGNVTGNVTGNLTGNAATATTAGTSTYVTTQDIRTLSPSSTGAYRMGFGFTSWANNNSAPYADYLALRSYNDVTGGNDNLVTFNKSTIAMRVWQQSFGSASAYSSYADVLMSNNYTSYAVATSTQSNWNGAGVINNVVGLMAWKNYGNNHVIFDASASTTPSGTACNNTNPDNAWGGSYPTLMGWNGANTYGVRVDSARYADNAGNLTGGTVNATTMVSSGRYTRNTTGGINSPSARFALTTSQQADYHISSSVNGASATNTQQYGITFSPSGGATQAGILISENGSDGTAIGFFCTNSYAVGPQLRGSFDPNGNFNAVGTVTGAALRATTGTPGNLGPISSSWQGNTSYPTLYGDSADRWVMHINPHISYTQNGVNGFTGTMTGACIRMASDAVATSYWDVGPGTSAVGADVFSIGRAGTSFLNINSSGNQTLAGALTIGGGFTITTPGSGYGYFNNWVQLPGYFGFYSPQNSAHFYPNNGSYGAWQIDGSRNGWQGIEFSGHTTLMMNNGASGFHRNGGGGWSFYVESGSGYFPGNVTAYWSDERLKENLCKMDREALDILGSFNAYRFNWNGKVAEIGGTIPVGKEEIGLIAQHVQRALPDAVVVNKAGAKVGSEAFDYLTINYDRITPLLVEGVNIHEEDIKTLQGEVRMLRAALQAANLI